MRGWLLVLALFLMPGWLRAETLFSIPWGNKDGQIGYYNARSVTGFDQPYSEGPGGIAVGPDDQVWISDQFHDRILKFDRKGNLLGAARKIGDAPIQRPRALWVD